MVDTRDADVGTRKEAKEEFASLKPRLGGLARPVGFSETQAAILNAAADELVPGGEGFPWPSEVRIVNFIGRYVTPSGDEPRHFPFAAEDEFKAKVDGLGEGFLSADPAGRVEILRRVEREEEAFFGQLGDLVYYAQPEVTTRRGTCTTSSSPTPTRSRLAAP